MVFVNTFCGRGDAGADCTALAGHQLAFIMKIAYESGNGLHFPYIRKGSCTVFVPARVSLFIRVSQHVSFQCTLPCEFSTTFAASMASFIPVGATVVLQVYFALEDLVFIRQPILDAMKMA